jgi:hypothetical protein
VIFEWNARKATSNLRKHGVSFGQAGSDPLALSYPDPDHSSDEHREITSVILEGSGSCSSPIVGTEATSGSSARGRRRGLNVNNMKKARTTRPEGKLRAE